ncbi:hypothetical protein AALP_AA1G116400 [Arabis alpina]|uniref:DYW domain-containing protein n=1 Tax=Arabis alpina TaxID=50452 RepID=A0A087HML2_ARAAL|nr:hypothetical protein AALP_AA1G116400 [Arabis alpina]
MEAARVLLRGMDVDDEVSLNSMVVECVRQGLEDEALSLFGRMHERGLKIDEFTIPSILNCFALSRREMNIACSVHCLMVKTGYGNYKLVNNALVDMYAKRGIMDSALKVFEEMIVKDVITWTALVTGNTHNGSYEEALKLFCDMRGEGISPDQIVTASVLSASAELTLLEFGQLITLPLLGYYAGLIEEAQHYFDSMRTVYGITPGPEHYARMIDLFGRSGDFVRVEELLIQMEVEPDATVWKAILAASRKHGNIENGERAVKTLMELEPNNAVPYVLLSNMYSAAGRQEEAENARRLMKSRNISKEPGCSWVEGKGKVHSFMSEDRRHPRMVEIYSKVDEMMVVIKEAGYLPDMSFALQDLDKEGKELGLAYHSEKLAVAFGLLAIPSGAPIRIIKNLRVCGE